MIHSKSSKQERAINVPHFFMEKQKNNQKNDDVLINIAVMKYDRNSVDPSNIYTPILGEITPAQDKQACKLPSAVDSRNNQKKSV